MNENFEHSHFQPKPPTKLSACIHRITVFGLTVLAAYALLWVAAKTMRAMAPEPVPEPNHVQELVATWGSFDEICLYRYYKRTDYPEQPVAPGHVVSYNDEDWTCVVCDDIIGTNFGDCWEAVFRRA